MIPPNLPQHPNGHQWKIGVMGSASGPFEPEHLRLVFRLGVAIAQRGLIMITGACPGLPLEAARGAKSKSGTVVGISPALSLDEHIHRYSSPTEYHDILIYTGAGLMGREVINIRTCDMVAIVGGKSGTLGEFAIAYDEGRLIGVLENTGGISSHIDEIVEYVDKQTGSVLCYNTDPEKLIDDMILKFSRPDIQDGPSSDANGERSGRQPQ